MHGRISSIPPVANAEILMPQWHIYVCRCLTVQQDPRACTSHFYLPICGDDGQVWEFHPFFFVGCVYDFTTCGCPDWDGERTKKMICKVFSCLPFGARCFVWCFRVKWPKVRIIEYILYIFVLFCFMLHLFLYLRVALF